MGKQKYKTQTLKNGHVTKGSVKETPATPLPPVEEEDCPPLPSLVPSEWHVVLATSIFISIYMKCTAASIPSGDAGDFILSAHHFGVAHPPGYPLYVTVGHVWMKLMPFGNPAYKLNLLTSIIGGLAASIVYLTTFRITGFIPGAIFASGVFGFSHLIWFHSVGAEIFSLNNAFCGLLLLWVVRFQHAGLKNRARVAMEASFVSGLSMCNQHTSGLFIAVIGAWMFLSLLRDKAITAKQFIQTGLAFAAALTPYVQLPLSASLAMSPSTWGDQRTFKGFWVHITREEYGTFRLTADDRPSDLFGNLITYTEDLVHELGIVTLVLCVVCVLSAWYFPKIRTIVYVYVATVLGYIMFFCMQANIDHSRNLMKGVLERFWMQSNIPVSVLSGCGMWCLYTVVIAKAPRVGTVLCWVLGVGAVLAAAHQIKHNYEVCDLSNNLIMQDYGRKLLDATPQNGVLMVEGDMPSLTSRYLRYCENYRTDVDVVDQELIGFPWFKPMHRHIYKHYIFPYDRMMYYKDVIARKGERLPFSYNFADVFKIHIDAGIPLNIYPFMKHGDEEWKKHFELWPTTMTYTVRYKKDPYTLDQFLDIAFNQDYNFNENMEYCDKELYPVRSWEYVIAESCGHTAFFGPEHAHRVVTRDETHSKPHGRPLLLGIFNLYRQAYNELTRVKPDGTLKHYFDPDHNKNYGVIAYLIYGHYVKEQHPDTTKYARILVDQWQLYFTRSGKPDKEGLGRVIKDALKRFPDLLTHEKHVML